MIGVLMAFHLVVISMLQQSGATERMNLCQALTSAMDITMEKDSAAGKITQTRKDGPIMNQRTKFQQNRAMYS